MKPKVFQFSHGYDYKEYSSMCDRVKEIKLPFTNGISTNRLLADYVFSISMDRMQFGWKNTLRRFLGSFFSYPYTTEFFFEDANSADVCFVFTLDEIGRPDYISALKKVACQCDRSEIIKIDRKRPFPSLRRWTSPFVCLIWAACFAPVIHDINICLDMAVYLYRAVKDGEDLFRIVKDHNPRRVVLFCDFVSIESRLVDLCKKIGIKTATLQHGNGDNIFYGSNSDVFLANSQLSKKNLIMCGVERDKIIICGPMKYAGESYEYRRTDRIKRIGIVFDGAKNFENNVEMIDIVKAAIESMGIECAVRFHPNNKPEDYVGHVSEHDIIFQSLDEFENKIDICVVYNSSMFSDMIYKKVPVVRFKNGRIDLFPELNDVGFSNVEQFQSILNRYHEDYDGFIESQKTIYKTMFGSQCGKNSYRNFFERWI